MIFSLCALTGAPRPGQGARVSVAKLLSDQEKTSRSDDLAAHTPMMAHYPRMTYKCL
jgi:hypothetical protein